MRENLPYQIDGAAHIDTHHEIEAAHVKRVAIPVDDLRGSRDARRSDHAAEFAAGLLDPLEGALDGGGDAVGGGDVGGEEAGAGGTEFLDEGFAAGGVEVEDGGVGAGGDEVVDGGSAEAGGAGDERG